MQNVNVTEADLLKFLNDSPNHGAKIVTVVSNTRPDFVGGSPFKKGSIIRVARRQITIGACYEAAVNRQRIT